jgi:hypothetical protein
MSLSSVNGTSPGIGEGSAVRMSAANYWWAGVVLALRPRGRAEVMITDPGDSIHCPGQLVIGSTHALEPLRGRAAGREQSRAQQLITPPPGAGDRDDEKPVRRLIEAIEEQGRAAGYNLDDAVAYLGQRIQEGCDAIACVVDLAARQQPRRRGWRRRR